MKIVLTILISFAFLIKSISSSFILLDYEVNKSLYELKCINKTQPQLKCHGKCQMMKKLREEEKKEQDEKEKNSESKTEPLSSKSFFEHTICPLIITSTKADLLYNTTGKVVHHTFDIFHPPKKKHFLLLFL
ncbi:MAG: hypothetical protein QM725_15170 [Lacibacter sp.]